MPLKSASKMMPTESDYLQKLFDARLEKENNKQCPKCNQPVKSNYRLVSGRKEFSCSICLNKVSPMAGTLFSSSSIPIAIWLNVTLRVHEAERTRREVMAKEIAIDFNHTSKTGYRMLGVINQWRNKYDVSKSLHKRKIAFKNRNEADILFQMILESSPPLFGNLKN